MYADKSQTWSITVIVASFTFRGELYIITDGGKMFRASTHGSEIPSEWTYEFIAEL
jgi:hypothetical protein